MKEKGREQKGRVDYLKVREGKVEKVRERKGKEGGKSLFSRISQ